ncbi:hypothetical protein GUJ93_ZPchr0002g23344 [Zizania palustris]|uniref:Uncharacterized protein n=1 Tax=Zizania palustris TaxID=103762 RepID=A0A8J5VFY1_ZIZPA|nr:hypothetical protein GUJ93_ZPchr0121g60 [Zizania palustris]KAG8058486.1 hypothetical protein GUJ93_ZPchr0002g23344 [Zizania palustris]
MLLLQLRGWSINDLAKRHFRRGRLSPFSAGCRLYWLATTSLMEIMATTTILSDRLRENIFRFMEIRTGLVYGTV